MTSADVTSIIQQIISILYGFLSEGAVAFGEGIGALVQNIFFTTTESGTSLSGFAVAVFIFAGLSLLIGLSRWVLNFVTSLGARNR